MRIKNPVLTPENVGRVDAGDPYIIREGGDILDPENWKKSEKRT